MWVEGKEKKKHFVSIGAWHDPFGTLAARGPSAGEVVKGAGPRSVPATRVGFCPRQGARHTVSASARLARFDLADGDGLTDAGF